MSSASEPPAKLRDRIAYGTVSAVVVLAGAVFALASAETAKATTSGFILLALFEVTLLGLAVAGAVHHAETIAETLGEPFGTLILTMAVTVIECSLILAIMTSGGEHAALARDTVFSVMMLVMNGLVGLCFLTGGLRFGEQTFRAASARSYLMVLIPFGVLTMVLPGFTVSAAGPFYSTAQIAFVAVVTLALYGTFLYVQTVRHRGFFDVEERNGDADASTHGSAGASVYLRLTLLLVAIVLLAKSFAGVLEAGVAAVGAPTAVVGVLVALLVLLPESVAAVQAARANQLQRSINLSLGSTLATIGLTFPAVGVLSLILGTPLVLALDPANMVLMILTLATSLVTLSQGRTNILSGSVHLVLLVTFVFLIFAP